MNLLMLTLAVLATAPNANNEEITSLGASLSALRTEVDGLSADVAAARAEAKEAQLGFARRRAALEGDIESARLLVRELQGRIESMERAHADKSTAAAMLEAPLRDALKKLRSAIEGGAPFQVRARLDRVAAVETALDASGGDVAAAVVALEPVLVEEARLARTTQRARQPIVIEGESVVADVVRIGTLAVLFRSPKGAVGYAAHDPAVGAAVWHVLADEADRARVQEIFDLYRGSKPPDRVVLVPRAALPAALPAAPPVRTGGAP